MTAKEILDSVYKAEKMIRNRIEQANRMMERLTAPSMCYEERIGIPGNRNLQGFVPGLERIMKYNEETEHIKAEYVDLQIAVESCIMGLENEKEQKVLKLYYLELKTFKQIAAEICYSEKQIKRIHDKAIHNLDELLKRCPEMSANVQKCPLNVHW